MLNQLLKICAASVLFLAASTLPRAKTVPALRAHAASPAGEKILTISANKLVMIDRATKAILWESTGLQNAYCVSALPNGEYLVGEYRSIARVDRDGKFIARSPAIMQRPTDVRPLDNGKMLVCDGPGGTVSEMDWDGNVTWSVKKLHFPQTAVRLGNGNTLVADGTAELKEFDSNGKLVRSILRREWIASAQRLADGKTLVGESHSLELLDASGQAIFSLQIPSRVTWVEQLSNNEYLICEPDAGQVAILSIGGNVIWETSGLRLPWRAVYIH